MAYEWQLLIGHRVNMTVQRQSKSRLSAQCTQGYDVDSLFSLVSVLTRTRQNRHELRGTFCKIRRLQFAFSEDFTLQNPKIAVCIFRICLAPGVVLTNGTIACAENTRRHATEKRRGKNRWFGSQRRDFLASFGKTLGLIPAEPVFRSQLARSAIWCPYFSQIRKFGIRCSEKPQGRKFASGYSGYQTSCFARRWVPNRQSWRAWIPNPLILSAFFDTRYQTPQFCHTSCAARYQTREFCHAEGV